MKRFVFRPAIYLAAFFLGSCSDPDTKRKLGKSPAEGPGEQPAQTTPPESEQLSNQTTPASDDEVEVQLTTLVDDYEISIGPGVPISQAQVEQGFIHLTCVDGQELIAISQIKFKENCLARLDGSTLERFKIIERVTKLNSDPRLLYLSDGKTIVATRIDWTKEKIKIALDVADQASVATSHQVSSSLSLLDEAGNFVAGVDKIEVSKGGKVAVAFFLEAPESNGIYSAYADLIADDASVEWDQPVISQHFQSSRSHQHFTHSVYHIGGMTSGRMNLLDAEVFRITGTVTADPGSQFRVRVKKLPIFFDQYPFTLNDVDTPVGFPESSLEFFVKE